MTLWMNQCFLVHQALSSYYFIYHIVCSMNEGNESQKNLSGPKIMELIYNSIKMKTAGL